MHLATIALCIVIVTASVLDAQEVVIGRSVIPREPPATPSSFEERNAQCAVNQRCQVDSLVLPLIAATPNLRPRRVAAGEYGLAISGSSPELHRYLWRIVPWQAAHAEFMEQYDTLGERAKDGVQMEAEKVKLAGWCEKNKQPDCAEFVLRDLIYHRAAHIENSLYRTNLGRWKAYAVQQPSPFTFRLPLEGRWHALVDLTKHHQKKHWAVFAYDIVGVQGESVGIGENLKENHFAWEQPVVAVADGVIVDVVDKHADHPIGQPASASKTNYLKLDCGGGVFADYAHLRQGSAAVKKGDRVTAGQMLARIGNSGASGAPHLHFTMSDGDGFSIPGRYLFQVYATKGWTEVNGIDMEEGWHFMSVMK